jgi:hypothetical protein
LSAADVSEPSVGSIFKGLYYLGTKWKANPESHMGRNYLKRKVYLTL